MVGVRSSKLWGGMGMVLVICCFGMVAQGKYGGGSGEPNDPYQIWGANDMQAIGDDANDWDKHFILMADTDLSQFDGKEGREKFNVIAPDANDAESLFQGIPFAGVFDGNDHTISNFVYDSNGVDFIGLFGCVDDTNAEIKNLGMIDPNLAGVTGGICTGSLAGSLENGTTANCYVSGGSVSGYFHVGGLAGDIGDGKVIECFARGTVLKGDWIVGGLVGSSGGTITNCHVTATVVGESMIGGLIGIGGSGGTVRGSSANASILSLGHYAGGLVGANWGMISDCYASGIVDGNDRVGGLVGQNGQDDGPPYQWSGTIRTSYAVGKVSGLDNVGGLVGYNEYGEISDCYWNIEASGEPNMCGAQEEGATGCDPNFGLPTSQLHQQSTFTDWDFINVWNIGENQTYPYLRQYSAADIDKNRVVNFCDYALICEQWMDEE